MLRSLVRIGCGVLALALLAAAGRGQTPAVLAQVPDNAVAVLVIKNVNALKDQLSSYGKAMGQAGPADPLPDILKAVGITDGFDAAGSLALVQVTLPAEAQPGSDPAIPFVVLMPTSDAKALLAGMTPGEVVDNITPITLPPATPAYAATMGKFVAISRNRAALVEFATHKGRMDKPAEELVAALDANDMTIWIDVAEEAKVLGPLWGPLAQMARLQARSTPGEAGAMQVRGLDMLDAVGATLASDARNVMVTARITNDGIALGFTGVFHPDSVMGKFAAAQKAMPAAVLTGLPAGSDVMAAAIKWDPALATTAMCNMMDFLPANPMLQFNPDMMQKLKQLMAQTIPLETGMRFGAYAPPGAKPTEMAYTTIVDAKEPQKVMDLTIKAAQTIYANPNPDGDVIFNVKVEPDALTVKGVHLTRTTTQVHLREETPDHPISHAVRRQFEQMHKTFPAEGLVSNMGVVNDKVVTIITRDEKVIAQTLEAVQNNTDNFSAMAGNPVVRALTLPDASALFFVRMDRFVQMAKAAAGMEDPAPASEPATQPTTQRDLLPLIGSLNAGTRTVTVQLAVPRETLLKLVPRTAEPQEPKAPEPEQEPKTQP